VELTPLVPNSDFWELEPGVRFLGGLGSEPDQTFEKKPVLVQ